MDGYLLSIILSFFIAYISRTKSAFLYITLLIGVMLILLPTTGNDYEAYKADYDSAYFTNVFPFFKTSAALTAEPFYKFYTALVSVMTGLPFQGFLALNFVICYYILFSKTNKYFKTYPSLLFIAMGLVSIVPTIFYFSPRSSISFIMAFLSFLSFVENKTKKGLLFAFLTIGFHSQFIPTLLILFITSFIYKYLKRKRDYYLLFIAIFILLLSLLKLPLVIFNLFERIIGYLPSASLIKGKLHYFLEGDGSIRITSLLSIIVYPVTYFICLKRNAFGYVMKDRVSQDFQNKFIYLMGVLVFLGFVINILMFGNAHVAGRLSRFSDYFLMIVLLPSFVLLFNCREIVVLLVYLLLFLSSPILYPTLYNFKLSIF